MKPITIGEEYSQEYRITCNDIDSEYRMTSQAMMNLPQDTIAAYLTTRHIAAFDLQKKGFTWVLSEYTIELSGTLPLWREMVIVTVSPTEISSAKLHIDYRISNREGETIITGTSIWSIIGMKTGRPETIGSHCTVCGESVTRHPRNVVKTLDRCDIQFHYITNISDIDFNGHVHNVSYLKIALSCIPFELARNMVVKKMIIRFLRQSYINEDLLCCIEKEEQDNSALSSISNGEGQEVCRISVTTQEVACRDFGDIVNRD